MTESNPAGSDPAQQKVLPENTASHQSIGKVLKYAGALSIVCVLLTQLIFPAHFETVDDLNFTLLLSGVGLAHEPTYLTWFSNVMITYPLMCLFKLCPNIPWYSIYLFAVLITSYTIFAAVFMLRFNIKLGTVFFLIYYVVVGAFVVNGLQYTSTAAILTQAGFLLAFCLPLTERFAPSEFPKWIIGLSLVVTIFASMVRFEPFMLVLLFSTITVIAVAPGNLNLVKRNSVPLLCFIVAVVIGSALKTFNNVYYDSMPAVGGIRELFKPFSDIADTDRELSEQPTPPRPPNQSIQSIEPNRLTQNDYALVKQFFICDRKIFTTEALSQAVSKSIIPFTERKLIWALHSQLLPFLLLCLACMPFLDRRLMTKRRLLIWGAGVASLILFMAFMMKIPPRIHFAIMTCAMTTLFAFIDRQRIQKAIENFKHAQQPKKLFAGTVIALTGAWLTYSAVSSLYDDLLFYNAKSEKIKSAIRRLDPRPGQMYIVLGTDAPYQYMRPFQNLIPYFAKFDIYRTSLWGVLPIGFNMLENHGMSTIVGACKSQDVFFLSNEEMNQLLAKFLHEHYSLRTTFVPIFSEPAADLRVYRIKVTQF